MADVELVDTEVHDDQKAAEVPDPVKAAAPKGLSLRKNFSWTFAGNVIHAICQWGVLVVLAKLGSPEMVGQYALGLAIATPLFMFTNLQLRAIQATDARDDFSFVDYRSLRFVATALGLVGLIGITVISGYGRTTGLVVFFVGLAKAFESVSDVYYGFAQRHERMDLIARSMTYKGLLSLGAMILLMYTTGSIVWASAGVAGAWLLRFLAYDVRFVTLLPEQAASGWDWSRSASLAKVALPLGLVMLLISLNTNIPRYFLQHEYGERAVGFYSAVAYLMVAGTTVVGALGQSASPRLAKQYAAGQTIAFRDLIVKLLVVAVSLGVAGIFVSLVAGKSLLAALYTDDYAAYAGLLTLVMIAALIQYIASFLGYGMTAARKFRVQLPLSVITVLTTLGASFYLVPRFGLEGAAIAVVLAAFVQAIGAAAVTYVALRSYAI